jgi:multidrug transporter EmrE-like cation transporter
MWLRLMTIAFVANGLAPFGLKLLQERGLLETYRLPYLLFWYLGALPLAASAFLWKRGRLRLCEVLIGGAMGACSLGGQLATAVALESLPGHMVFAITTGGSLFVVAAAGICLFRERVGEYGLAGIGLGIVSLLLLGTS